MNRKTNPFTFRALIRRHRFTLMAILGVMLLFLVWEIVALIVRDNMLVPSPIEVLVIWAKLFTQSAFYIATGHTLLRCLIAFAISVILGVGLGILAGLKPSFAELLRPFVHLVKAAPTMALTLLILVWFRQKATPVVIATMLVFPILYSTVSSAVQATDKGLLEMASVYQLRTKDKLKCIYVPHILPLLVDNAATAFSMCIKATISAEILALVPQSMGSSMKFAKDGIIEGAGLLFSWLLMAILLSVLVEVLLRLLAKRIKRSYHISEV